MGELSVRDERGASAPSLLQDAVAARVQAWYETGGRRSKGKLYSNILQPILKRISKEKHTCFHVKSTLKEL